MKISILAAALSAVVFAVPAFAQLSPSTGTFPGSDSRVGTNDAGISGSTGTLPGMTPGAMGPGGISGSTGTNRGMTPGETAPSTGTRRGMTPGAAPGSLNPGSGDGAGRGKPQNSSMNTDRQEDVRERRAESDELRRIREAVQRAPAEAVAAAGERVRDLKVRRKNGKVYMTGRVSTQAEKDAAGERASEAAGQQVVNQLTVK